jgi:uncharacterized protein YdaU (DUF1376 family)
MGYVWMTRQPRKIKVDYVAFYFRDFLGDLVKWPPEFCGAYIRLCCSIYDAGGYLSNNMTELSSIAGFNEMEFVKVWNTLRAKFCTKDGIITHKRCTLELRKADRFIQNQRKAGLMSAKKRQQRSNGVATANQPSEQSRAEQSRLETTSESESNAHLKNRPNPITISLTVYEQLDKILEPQHRKDKSTIRNFCNWLASQQNWRQGMEKAFEVAKTAMAGIKSGDIDNRFGYFIGAMKNELGYIPNGGRK